MAERRMFAKSTINSARFLRMPPSSRLLYYDLGMAADDDGVVEAFTVMRTTGATEDDLRVLASKGFVRVLNDDFVSLITDWRRNNLIKADRYRPSVYADLLAQLDDGTNLEPTWNPSGTQMEPQVRLGKERIDEREAAAASTPKPKPKPEKHKFGEYRNVLLSDSDMDKLQTEFPNDWQQRIENLSVYMETHPQKHYRNHLAVIRNWARADAKKQAAEQPPERQFVNFSELDGEGW